MNNEQMSEGLDKLGKFLGEQVDKLNKLTRKFQKGDIVKVKATGHKAKVYDYETAFGEVKVLIRFFGRHSLDLFTEEELEKIK